MRFLRQVRPEYIKPVAHRRFRKLREFLCLQNRYLHRPRPQEHPELDHRQLQILEPCVREKGESAPARTAPVPASTCDYFSRPALRAEHAFAKERAPYELSNLWITRYLVKCVHVHILRVLRQLVWIAHCTTIDVMV